MTGQSRVLVVDDDDTVREVLRRYLTRDGHEVIEAADGITGLGLVRSQHPDLVVLDLMLPGMDGLEVCREIRRTSTHPGDHADRTRAGVRSGGRPRIRRRRLRRQAVQPAGTGPAGGSGAGTQPREPSRRQPGAALVTSADGELSADPVSRTARLRGRRAGVDQPRVRPAALPAATSRPGVRPGRDDGTGVGLDVRRPVDRHRPRPPAPGEDRTGPGPPDPDRHGLGGRLPAGPRARRPTRTGETTEQRDAGRST